MAIDVAKWRSLVTKTRAVATECSVPTSDGRGLWEMEWSWRKMTDSSQAATHWARAGRSLVPVGTSRVLRLGRSWGFAALTSGRFLQQQQQHLMAPAALLAQAQAPDTQLPPSERGSGREWPGANFSTRCLQGP